MKRFLFYIFIFLSVLPSWAAVTKAHIDHSILVPSEQYFSPLFTSLFKSIQFYRLEKGKSNIDHLAKDFSTLIKKVDPKNLNTLIDTQIIQEIFAINNWNHPPISSFGKESVLEFEKYLNDHNLEFSLFSQMITKMILKDMHHLLSSPYLPTYKKRMGSKIRYQNAGELKFFTLLEKLLSWKQFIMSLPPDEVNNKILSKGMNVFVRINHLLKTYEKVVYIPEKKENNKNEKVDNIFVSYHYKPNTINHQDLGNKNISEIVDSIVDSIVEKKSPANTDSKKEQVESDPQWRPKETVDLSTLELFPTPDPHYQAPPVLPTPINDWDDYQYKPNLRTLNLFPTPDPNYIPPNNLPTPIPEDGSWGL